MAINKELITYINTHITPLYQMLDLAHSGDHVDDVIKRSLEIAKAYDVDLDMVFVVAAFHDVGLIEDRKLHHLIGGQMLEKDSFIHKYFSLEQIKIMKEAVEDHRASLKTPPRSIYGKIVAEADRAEDVDKVIKRCILFQYKDGMTFDDLFPPVYEHIISKYGVDGYLKVWLKTPDVEKMLFDIRKLLKDPVQFKEYTKQMFNQLNLD